MTQSIDWYNQNAARFYEATAALDVAALHAPFLALLPASATILDAGCGSGRDAKLFAAQDYQVTAFDASEKMVEMARQNTGLPVLHLRFDDLNFRETFDGIWASASLLHVPRAELSTAFQKLIDTLKPGGVWYFSFKVGQGERAVNGRRFTDFTLDAMQGYLKQWSQLIPIRLWQAPDSRPNHPEEWINVLVRKGT